MLRSFCRHTSFSENGDYRLDARLKLPRAAAILLLSEVRANGQFPPLEFKMLADALDVVAQQRGGVPAQAAIAFCRRNAIHRHCLLRRRN